MKADLRMRIKAYRRFGSAPAVTPIGGDLFIARMPTSHIPFCFSAARLCSKPFLPARAAEKPM
jgi:hypothetical protein